MKNTRVRHSQKSNQASRRNKEILIERLTGNLSSKGWATGTGEAEGNRMCKWCICFRRAQAYMVASIITAWYFNVLCLHSLFSQASRLFSQLSLTRSISSLHLLLWLLQKEGVDGALYTLQLNPWCDCIVKSWDTQGRVDSWMVHDESEHPGQQTAWMKFWR